ncbi:MAG: co-chaperone GroES family protein [Bacteroidales bacterium]|jgi:co-chaperonin GroES (HSP10)|nr:co-chaperone GroES family protein [Bacteroidales bacterium]
MPLQIDQSDFSNFFVVGDRVLIQPKSPLEKTKGGLLLPPGIQETERIQSGWVVKVGPGYPIPTIVEADEAWKNKSDTAKYVPLQSREGDLAVYLQNNAYEISFNGEKYVIVSQSDILLLIRDQSLFE